MLRVLSASIAFIFILGGCAAKGSYWPDKERWKNAFVNAASDPLTWVPAAGAVAISAAGLDHTISDKAREEAPLFGSAKNAEKASDDFRLFTRYSMLATTLLVYDGKEYMLPMAERMAWAHVATGLTGNATDILKEKSARERPNAVDKRSFPSGHTSSAFVNAGMSNRNVGLLPISDGWRYTAYSVNTFFAAGTAWARVEAGAHYPADVLAGAALGNFIALFVHDAFLINESSLHVQPDTYGTLILTFQKEF